MGCEAPRDEIEEIICQVIDEENPALGEIRQETSNNLIEERERIEAGEKIGKTVRLIGAVERDFIHSYFQIPYEAVEAVERIKQIQERLGFVGNDIDGIIGPGTLKQIYIQEYSGNIENMPRLQQTRWEAYLEVGQEYPDWERYVREKGRVVNLHVLNKPNVFNRNYYFGQVEGFPENGGYINSELRNKVNPNIAARGVQGFLRNIDGKFVIVIYVDGVLNLVSYSSPGNTARYGRGARTPEIQKTNIRLDSSNPDTLTTKMHFISGGKDSVSDTQRSDGSYQSAPMPYAVAIDNTQGIYTHGGYVTGDELSHGCPRLPLHYAKGVYEIFEKYGEIHWDTHYS